MSSNDNIQRLLAPFHESIEAAIKNATQEQLNKLLNDLHSNKDINDILSDLAIDEIYDGDQTEADITKERKASLEASSTTNQLSQYINHDRFNLLNSSLEFWNEGEYVYDGESTALKPLTSKIIRECVDGGLSGNGMKDKFNDMAEGLVAHDGLGTTVTVVDRGDALELDISGHPQKYTYIWDSDTRRYVDGEFFFESANTINKNLVEGHILLQDQNWKVFKITEMPVTQKETNLAKTIVIGPNASMTLHNVTLLNDTKILIMGNKANTNLLNGLYMLNAAKSVVSDEELVSLSLGKVLALYPPKEDDEEKLTELVNRHVSIKNVIIPKDSNATITLVNVSSTELSIEGKNNSFPENSVKRYGGDHIETDTLKTTNASESTHFEDGFYEVIIEQKKRLLNAYSWQENGNTYRGLDYIKPSDSNILFRWDSNAKIYYTEMAPGSMQTQTTMIRHVDGTVNWCAASTPTGPGILVFDSIKKLTGTSEGIVKYTVAPGVEADICLGDFVIDSNKVTNDVFENNDLFIITGNIVVDQDVKLTKISMPRLMKIDGGFDFSESTKDELTEIHMPVLDIMGTVNLQGMKALETVNTALRLVGINPNNGIFVTDCPKLEELVFDKLTRGGNIQIAGNANLRYFETAMVLGYGSIHITNNPELAEVNFAKLKELLQQFLISENPKLTLVRLDALMWIGGSLIVGTISDPTTTIKKDTNPIRIVIMSDYTKEVLTNYSTYYSNEFGLGLLTDEITDAPVQSFFNSSNSHFKLLDSNDSMVFYITKKNDQYGDFVDPTSGSSIENDNGERAYEAFASGLKLENPPNLSDSNSFVSINRNFTVHMDGRDFVIDHGGMPMEVYKGNPGTVYGGKYYVDYKDEIDAGEWSGVYEIEPDWGGEDQSVHAVKITVSEGGRKINADQLDSTGKPINDFSYIFDIDVVDESNAIQSLNQYVLNDDGEPDESSKNHNRMFTFYINHSWGYALAFWQEDDVDGNLCTYVTRNPVLGMVSQLESDGTLSLHEVYVPDYSTGVKLVNDSPFGDNSNEMGDESISASWVTGNGTENDPIRLSREAEEKDLYSDDDYLKYVREDDGQEVIGAKIKVSREQNDEQVVIFTEMGPDGALDTYRYTIEEDLKARVSDTEPYLHCYIDDYNFTVWFEYKDNSLVMRLGAVDSNNALKPDSGYAVLSLVNPFSANTAASKTRKGSAKRVELGIRRQRAMKNLIFFPEIRARGEKELARRRARNGQVEVRRGNKRRGARYGQVEVRRSNKRRGARYGQVEVRRGNKHRGARYGQVEVVRGNKRRGARNGQVEVGRSKKSVNSEK